MAKNDNLTDFLTDVANSIRKKKGGSAKINPQNFSSEIESIKTTPNLQTPSAVTPNDETQTIKPGSGYDGLAQVVVNPVPAEEKTVTAGTSATSAIPSSGKYLKKVTINPTPSETKSVSPSMSQQNVTPSSGKLLSQVTVKGDNNLKAANIIEGVSIFGIQGTAKASAGVKSYLGLQDTQTFSNIANGETVIICINCAYDQNARQVSFAFPTSGKTFAVWGGYTATLAISRVGNTYYCAAYGNVISQTVATTTSAPQLTLKGADSRDDSGELSTYMVEITCYTFSL